MKTYQMADKQNGKKYDGDNGVIDSANGFNGCTLWKNTDDKSDITFKNITQSSSKETCCFDLNVPSKESGTNYEPLQSWIVDSSPSPPTPADASNSNYIINQQNKHGNTALIVATKRSHRQVVQSLLDWDSDLFLRNNEGKTVYEACAPLDGQIANLLKQKETEIRKKGKRTCGISV